MKFFEGIADFRGCFRRNGVFIQACFVCNAVNGGSVCSDRIRDAKFFGNVERQSGKRASGGNDNCRFFAYGQAYLLSGVRGDFPGAGKKRSIQIQGNDFRGKHSIPPVFFAGFWANSAFCQV